MTSRFPIENAQFSMAIDSISACGHGSCSGGRTYDRYPSFDGVEPGTRATYTDPAQFIAGYGVEFDRTGQTRLPE